MKFRGQKPRTISAIAWIAIQAEHVATTRSLFAPEVAHRIMSAALVSGRRTEGAWDSLYATAVDADATMEDADNFG